MTPDDSDTTAADEPAFDAPGTDNAGIRKSNRIPSSVGTAKGTSALSKRETKKITINPKPAKIPVNPGGAKRFAPTHKRLSFKKGTF